jgi:hypothetical protein
LPIIKFPPIESSTTLLKYVKGLETTIKKARQSIQSDESSTSEDEEVEPEEILESHMSLMELPTRNIIEYGTKLYAPREFKIRNLNTEEFTAEYRSGNLKITVPDNNKYTITQLLHLIDNQRVFCRREDIRLLNITEFRKIRVEAKSPEHAAIKRLKTKHST